MTTSPNAPDSNNKAINSEIRFAVVMYGGVSLAIYMNGIAQELLNLVRSTSQNKLDGTAAVYSEIAKYLSEKDGNTFPVKFVIDIISGTSAGGINGVCLAKSLVCGLDNLDTLEKTWLDEGDFSKLLNDKKSEPDRYAPQEPKTSLFNSQRMYAKLLAAFQKMQEDSDKLHGKSTTEERSHIEAMNLFVTTTDLRGLQRPIVLSNGKALERIHKHVFPFVFRSEKTCPNRDINHFTGEYDPMLAFASRCTSSFPTAFEPVTLETVISDIEKIDRQSYDLFKNRLGEYKSLFFSPYDPDSDNNIPLIRREFSDGGYLDNRPFGHAINAIYEREAYCPVKRKLLYIDPVPEPKDENFSCKEISFIKNTMLAAFSLPGYETIREELVALKERNEWIDRVNGIKAQLCGQNAERLKNIIINHFLTNDFRDSFNSNKRPSETLDEDKRQSIENLLFAFRPTTNKNIQGDSEALFFWTKLLEVKKAESDQQPSNQKECSSKHDARDLDEMRQLLGSVYTTYHFTRLDMVTDQLADTLLRAMNAATQQDVSRVLNKLLIAWRDRKFKPNLKDCGNNPAIKTQNIFFRYYDIEFRIRRLNYFRDMIQNVIAGAVKNEQGNRWLQTLCFNLLPEDFSQHHVTNAQTIWRPELERSLRKLHQQITDSTRDLYWLRELLRSESGHNPLSKYVHNLKQQIEQLISEAPDILSSGNIVDYLDKNKEALPARCGKEESRPQKGNSRKQIEQLISDLDSIMKHLHNLVKDGVADKKCKGTIPVSNDTINALTSFGTDTSYNSIAGRMLYIYDYGYDLYDSAWLPLLAGGKYGEGNIVDVYRISPLDAVSLWNEKEEESPKLAGIALGSFGAFLDRQWRHNDILWGRLDATERIISSLLTDETEEQRALKRHLLTRAQQVIVDEMTQKWLIDLEKTRFSNERDQKQYEKLLTTRAWFKLDNRQTSAQQPIPEQPRIQQEKKMPFTLHSELEPEPALQYIGRSSSVLSSMIERLKAGEIVDEKISKPLKKLSWILLGMLDFSTPKTIWGVLSVYWMQLLMLISIVLLGVGYVLGKNPSLAETGQTISKVGWLLLLADLIIMSVRYNLETTIHKLSGNSWIRKMLEISVSLAGIVLFAILFISVIAIFSHGSELSGELQSLWNTFSDSFMKILTMPFRKKAA